MTYSQEKVKEMFEYILLEIEKGRATRNILKDDCTPDITTFYRWLAEDKEKSKRYACACEVRAEKLFDEMLDIADDGTNDTYIAPDGSEMVKQDHIQRSRLRIDTRKWILSKLNPKKYWEKLDMTSGWKTLPTPILPYVSNNHSDTKSLGDVKED